MKNYDQYIYASIQDDVSLVNVISFSSIDSQFSVDYLSSIITRKMINSLTSILCNCITPIQSVITAIYSGYQVKNIYLKIITIESLSWRYQIIHNPLTAVDHS